MGDIFKSCFNLSKDIIEQKIKKVAVSGFGLSRKCTSKKTQSLGKRGKVKDIFTQK